ncbi:MAG: response regulator transcription factor [Acidobacteria bacterium]|nr:MAG: response regulator transcription factor [Acidobacteriota bacterium]
MAIRLLLADDHEIVRQSLRLLLEHEGFQVLAEASDGHTAVKLATTCHPQVAVLDLNMPLLNGLDAAREIVRQAPNTRCVLLTMHSDERYVLEALQAGISGYVLKSKSSADLVRAINEAASGSMFLSPAVSGTLVHAYLNRADPNPEVLGARERQVLQLVAEGKTTKEIASLLGITLKTAESHRTHIMDKLGVRNVAGLVRYAIRRGLIQP